VPRPPLASRKILPYAASTSLSSVSPSDALSKPPIASPAEIARENAKVKLDRAREHIVLCERCPRLRLYCKAIGAARRRAYLDQTYWARPVPGFGDPRARILILGLAPGAHGANRTGRPFTGDGSGDFMFPILHSLGLASKPRAVSREDGLRLRHAWIASVVRCAPPGDKPLPQEIRNCSSHLAAEIAALSRVRVVVCLGKIAWDGYLAHLVTTGILERRSPYVFAHGTQYKLPNNLHLLATYHPSLRNTNTGRLDAPMFARVFVRARELAGLP
jgi:uracil-DNA glycosylase family 4